MSADKHYIVPRITDDNYIDTILDICRKEKIIGVFSLIDPECRCVALHRTDGVKGLKLLALIMNLREMPWINGRCINGFRKELFVKS